LAALVACALPLLVASKGYNSSASAPRGVPLIAPQNAAAPLQATTPAPALPARTRAEFGRERPSRDAAQIAHWVVHSGDHAGMPFVIVDKRKARVYAFDAGGALRGAAPVLLGLARGDQSVPGIGERKMAEIRPYERTTPAGRFVAELGVNTKGEDIIWVDYDSAVSMHRVRANNPKERRLSRLSTPTPDDNRISYGCINVPVSFYETVLMPAMAAKRAIVYVLPETRQARQLFGAYDVDPQQKTSAASRQLRPDLAQVSTGAPRAAKQ
jgi:hypothetical protein